MITKPTVFILGAGASMDYGFPSGADLVRAVCHNVPDTLLKVIFHGAISTGEISAEMEGFRQAVLKSACHSIDALLEDRSDLRELGVRLLAGTLMLQEIGGKLHKDGWYRYLMKCLQCRMDKFHENRLTIITFNYDRSLEQFLFNALKHRFNQSDSVTADMGFPP